MAEESDDNKKKIRWSPEKVMSISALFVSIISVIALFYQLNLAREENGLIRKQQSASVLPHVTLSFSLSSEEYKMLFINKGVGPAFIKKVEFSVGDSEKFERSDFFANYIGGQIRESRDIAIPISTYSFQEGDVIPANDKIDVITIKNQDGIRLFRQFLDSIQWNYHVIYEDVYGERWELSLESDTPTLVPEK